MASNIDIIFGAGLAVDEVISFKYKDLASSNPTLEHIASSVWKQPRTQAGEVNRNDPNPLPYSAQLCALDYYQQFITDYNVPSIFIVKSGLLNSVNIEAINDGIEFLGFTTSDNSVTHTITNIPYIVPYGIENVEYLEATVNNNCTHIKIRVTTNKATTSVTSPVNLTPNSITFEFEVLRGTIGNIICFAGLESESKGYQSPSVLENPIVNVTNTPSGANVLLSVNNIDLTKQWSLNGIDYQNSSVFQAILTGNYTAYVKDQYNCIKTTGFSIDIFTPQKKPKTPIFYVSNANSIRFKECENWNNKDIYKTDDNTLSFEEDKSNNKGVSPYYQKWQKNDIEPTEIQTNYKNISVKVYENGVETSLLVDKKTTNIDRKDKRDARIFEMADGNTGIYFLSGNIYDYDTNLVTGSYQLNSDLPEWAVIGNSIFIQETNTYLTINNIDFDPQKGKDILILDPVYVGIEKDTIVDTIYNIFPWEIYRVETDMSQFDCFQILIEATDDVFLTRTKLSEIQRVSEYQLNTIELKYKSTVNNDVYYAINDLFFTLRLDNTGLIPVIDDEREIHKSDTQVTPLDSEQHRKKEITFTGLSTVMAEKVAIACGQEIISLKRELFTTESIDIEPIGNSNMNNVKVVLYRTQENIDSSLDVDLIFPVTTPSPTLLDIDGTGSFSVVDPIESDGYLSVL